MARPVLGFVLAPIVGVAVSLAVVFGREVLVVWWVYLLVGGAVAYVSALLFGLPAYLLMKRRGKLRAWQIVLIGALCGLPFWVISEFPFASAYFRNQGLQNLILYLIAGGTAGLVFWAITRPSAPSNSALLTDTAASPLRAQHGAAKRER